MPFFLSDKLLGEIFIERPALASAWLSARIQEAAKDKDQIAGYRLERAFAMAANSLKLEERQSLLRTMFPFPHDYLVATPLIGDSIQLYQELLVNKNMKHLHLYPLYGKPTDSWVLRAIAAANAGYNVKEIARATMWQNMRFVLQSGKESEIWADWIKNFEPYLLHAEERIREVARILIDNASSSRDRALREELQEAVFGRNY